MPNNYTYRFSDRRPGKHHDHHHHHHRHDRPAIYPPFYSPFYPPNCNNCRNPWFWLLGNK